MAFHLSTRERMLLLIDDMEMITKELIEQAIIPKHQKLSPTEHLLLVELLVMKDEELRSMLEIAADQAQVEETMEMLRGKVEVQDEQIHKLQKFLKDGELILLTAIFQARQKLNSVSQANKRPVASEELIKYAHRISSANAVSAPLTWCIGDLRRPYPTDIEMRNGFLGKSDLNINGSNITQQGTVSTEAQRSMGETPTTFQSQFNWNQLGELHMSMGTSGSSVALETRQHIETTSQDDVEVMSTDSSSSSSSDSQ